MDKQNKMNPIKIHKRDDKLNKRILFQNIISNE